MNHSDKVHGALVHVTGAITKTKKLLMTGAASIAFVVAAPLVVQAASPSTVYDATPQTLPPNVASIGYEATSTSEAGDYIHLAGTNRELNTITTTMSDWAVYSDYSTNPTYSKNHVSWTHPITVNVYSSHLGANGVPDQLLATKTQTITIPWRQAADPTCATPTNWRASDGNCYGGVAFNATFDLSSQHVVLPSDVIVSVAYNTADYGLSPLHVAGPYNSLNVGVPDSQVVSVGRDDDTNSIFWNTSYAPNYADGGAAGVGILRKDTGWRPYGTVAFKLTATPAVVGAPTSLAQCLNGGWKNFTDPSFKGQGACTQFALAQASGSLKMADPSQKIVFSVANSPSILGNLFGQNSIEYWNYDYPGGLHFTAKVTCSFVDPKTKEARFLFQIPSGHGSLSGQYVVSYVKDVNNGKDLYAHTATSDLATATQWCQTGAGYNPTFYTVTQGSTLIF